MFGGKAIAGNRDAAVTGVGSALLHSRPSSVVHPRLWAPRGLRCQGAGWTVDYLDRGVTMFVSSGGSQGEHKRKLQTPVLSEFPERGIGRH